MRDPHRFDIHHSGVVQNQVGGGWGGYVCQIFSLSFLLFVFDISARKPLGMIIFAWT